MEARKAIVGADSLEWPGGKSMKQFAAILAIGWGTLLGAATSDSVQVLTTTHFAIYWLNGGPNAPVAGDADLNGRPDYVDSAAANLEATYRVLADSLHYRLPRAQTTTIYTHRKVSSGLYPVEILDLATANSYWQGTGTYGCIHDSSESPDGHPGTQIWLENDFLDNGTDSIVVGIRGQIFHNWVKAPYKALKFAVAHELYHAFTYEYDDVWTYAFHEMSAVWFESWYAPELQNHWRYLPLFRDNLLYGAFNNSAQQGYGNYLYLKAIVDLYGVNAIRKLWEDRAALAPGNDDAAWFKSAWARMKLDTISNLTRYYGENAVKLITGQSGKFDDGGALIGKVNPAFESFKLDARDTIESQSWTSLIGAYGIYPLALSKGDVPSGANVVALTNVPISGGNLVVVHYPSHFTQLFDVTNSDYVIGWLPTDTMLLLVNVTGEIGNSWNYYATTRTAGIHPRTTFLKPTAYTRSFDLFGRPVPSSGSRQVRIDLNATTDGSRRRFGR